MTDRFPVEPVDEPTDEPADLPSDPLALVELLRSIDPVEAPELVGRIADALEAALAEAGGE